jgi:hypothetical protein
MFLKKKTKSVYLPRFHVMCMHELLLGSSPNYEKQIGAMAQSMPTPLLSIYISSRKLVLPQNLLQIFPLHVPVFVSTVPLHSSSVIIPERKGKRKTNIFPPNYYIISTSSHHHFLIMGA